MTNGGNRPPAGFGKGVNDYLNHYITLTDTKAGALLATSVAMGALLLSEDWQTLTTLGKYARGAALALLAIAAGFSAWVVYPRLPSGRRGVVFWEDMSHPDLDAYAAAVQQLDEGAVELEYAAQNYFVSSVVHRKLQESESESEPGLCWPAGGGASGDRPRLAGHLHALRSRIFRRPDLSSRTDRKSVWSNRVTYVSGMNCYLSPRNGPAKAGVPTGIRGRLQQAGHRRFQRECVVPAPLGAIRREHDCRR